MSKKQRRKYLKQNKHARLAMARISARRKPQNQDAGDGGVDEAGVVKSEETEATGAGSTACRDGHDASHDAPMADADTNAGHVDTTDEGDGVEDSGQCSDTEYAGMSAKQRRRLERRKKRKQKTGAKQSSAKDASGGDGVASLCLRCGAVFPSKSKCTSTLAGTELGSVEQYCIRPHDGCICKPHASLLGCMHLHTQCSRT